MLAKIKKLRHKIYLGIYGHCPIKKNKIIAWNSLFKGFGDSPKYIIEYLCENFPDKYDIVWVYDRTKSPPKDLPRGVRAVPYFSIEYLKEISTAKIIISNIRTGDMHYFNKRKGQFYIQTWHSSIRLKKIEGDAVKFLGEDYAKRAKADSDKCDLIVSGCKFSTDIFKNSFWYDGDILEGGTPRCDIFFKDNAESCEKVRKYFSLDKGTKTVLYAPTFRDSECDALHGIDCEGIINALQAKFGGKWAFLYRLHPNVAKDIAPPCGGAYDATSYPDIQELIASCDLLITDYSSCMFDMAIRKMPCVLYVPDMEKYLSDERGFYFGIDELPFPYALDNEALTEYITNFDTAGYENKINEFLANVGSYENGTSCKALAEKIAEITK